MDNFLSSLYPWFKVTPLNSVIVLAICLFSILSLIYSFRFMQGKKGLFQYYSCLILSGLVSIFAVLSNDLRFLLVFWGFLGFILYLLITMNPEAGATAKKTFIIVGGSDAFMLLGMGIIYYLSGTFQIDKIRISLPDAYGLLPAIAYLCIAIACFAKAGAMPFHSWIPDCSEDAPLPVVAYVLAALDKLLGIYLLVKISLDLFVMSQAMNIFLMLIGAFTIIIAVLMALVQHNMKGLLGFHSVSQVGYMVLGIGTGTPIGIAGGMFHMLNNSIYKQALFFNAGNVEKKFGTTELDKLGGLSKVMPLTYISCLIASLSISGVPPFNGFFSKWMVYRGLIDQCQAAGSALQITSIFCLVIAMFGSGLTLASFMKLLHAVFLGQQETKKRDEVCAAMWLPCMVLALLCVLFGVFANQIPLKYFILPAVGGSSYIEIPFLGLSALLIILGLILGVLIFRLKSLRPIIRQDTAFIGAEPLETKVTGVEFYNTVKEYGVLKTIYAKSEKGAFDIYEQGRSVVFGLGKFLQFLHNGVLPTYLVWTLLGMMGLFWFLTR